jgi:uncharacterized protein YbjT (DUF2867 family)
VLIVAGGCRGRRLAEGLVRDGHAVRITTRTEAGRAPIEELGAECWIGTPDRLATLRGSLDGVAVVCWLLGTASGSEEELVALHSTRLELFLTQTIDTTARGFLYEARGTAANARALLEGERILLDISAKNRIPAALLCEDPADAERWPAVAREVIDGFLSPQAPPTV